MKWPSGLTPFRLSAIPHRIPEIMPASHSSTGTIENSPITAFCDEREPSAALAQEMQNRSPVNDFRSAEWQAE
jgi:hypothetical protein